MIVTLSRPRLARVPRMMPSSTPGLTSGGTTDAQDCTMISALSKNLGTSTPITAAGTIPKWDNTEYRPPMVGTPWAMCRK